MITRNNEMNKRDNEHLELLIEVLFGLQYNCGLNLNEIIALQDRFNIIAYIDSCYDLFHVQGLLATLFDLRDYLKLKGETLNVKEIY